MKSTLRLCACLGVIGIQTYAAEPPPKPNIIFILAEGKITEEVVANMRSWKHSGFSVDQSARLEAGDSAGVQRLIEVTQHVPDPGEHLIRYYGWYSNKSRGQRAQRQPPASAATAAPARSPTAREFNPGQSLLWNRCYSASSSRLISCNRAFGCFIVSRGNLPARVM